MSKTDVNKAVISSDNQPGDTSEREREGERADVDGAYGCAALPRRPGEETPGV